MKSCIDIRSGARNAEGALVVILGIAKKRDAAREEKERVGGVGWRDRESTLRHQPRQSSTGAAHMLIKIVSSVCGVWGR